MLATVGVVLAYGGPAFADKVLVNDVAVGGKDTFTAPGSTSVSYKINGQNNDGQNGCNAEDGSPASVTVHAPPAVVVSWADTKTATTVFPSCSTFKSVSLSSSIPGDYPISVTVSDSGVGTYATSDAAFTLHVRPGADVTPPDLTAPGDQTVEAVGPDGTAFSYSATAFDAGDNAATPVSCSPLPGAVFAIGTTTVTCTSTDSKGNIGRADFAVTVRDTTGPALTLTDQTAEAAGAAGAAVTFSATSTDLVDSSRPVSCSHRSGDMFPIGATTVRCSTSDTRGNATSGSFTVSVRDTTAPTLTLTDETIEATGADGATVEYLATASDLVDGLVEVACDRPAGSTFPLGETTVRCSAEDTAGNRANGSFTVEVGDNHAPALSLTDVTAEATAPDGAEVAYLASANDIVDGDRPIECSPGSGTTFPIGATTVHCSSVDSRGNTALGSLTVTVQDNTPPALALTDGAAEATGPDGATVDYTATAADAVDGAVLVSCDKAAGAMFPVGTTTVTCSATDAHGNTSAGTFAVRVTDTTAPELTLVDQAKEADGADGAAVGFAATANDLVDGGVPVTCSAKPGDRFPLGGSSVTCTASDEAGNKATGSFTVTVVDTTPPALNLSDVVVEATGHHGAIATYPATAEDLVDGDVAVSCSIPSGDVFPLGATHVSCTASDSRHNFGIAGFTVRVVDTTPPDLILSDLTLEATGPDGAAVDFIAGADDRVDGSVPATCSAAPGSTFGLGSTSVRCTAADAAGNESVGTFTVNVQDTTAPRLDLADQTVEATGPGGAAVTYAANASDLVSGDRDVSCDIASGSTFPIANTTVTCTATDAAGNKAEGAFVVAVGDHTAPSLNLVDQEAEASSPAGAYVGYDASAADVVDGPRPVDCSPAAGSLFPLGVTTADCSASDTRGNTATGRLNVTVKDSTPPALTLRDAAVEATGPAGAAVSYLATASDLVSGEVAVECDRPAGGTFPLGTTKVTCLATDERGNRGTGTLVVTVHDTVAPDLALADQTVEATGPDGASVEYAASAADLVDGDLPVVCSLPSGSAFPLGVTPVTCAATDQSGNTATGGFQVSVVDTAAPILSVADQTVEATGPDGASVTYGAAATDVVAGEVAVTCLPAAGSVFPVGVTDVACAASDSHGNSSSANFHVIVRDTTAPELTVPADIDVVATSALGAKISYAATATDLVAAAPSVSCTPASGSTFGPGVTTVACTATDGAGNTSAAQTFRVNVRYAWSNLLQPVNVDGSSVFKAGSTVPTKFKLTGASSGIGNLPAKLYFAKTSNNTPGTYVEASSTSAADSGNAFRYDAVAAQYIFNLSTKGWSEGSYQLRVDLGDGVPHTVNITVKR